MFYFKLFIHNDILFVLDLFKIFKLMKEKLMIKGLIFFSSILFKISNDNYLSHPYERHFGYVVY
jgi:hypothetical protein